MMLFALQALFDLVDLILFVLKIFGWGVAPGAAQGNARPLPSLLPSGVPC